MLSNAKRSRQLSAKMKIDNVGASLDEKLFVLSAPNITYKLNEALEDELWMRTWLSVRGALAGVFFSNEDLLK